MNIEQQLTINAKPQVVFNALSTNEGIKGWWSKSSIVGEKEGKLTLLKFDKNSDGNITDMLFRTSQIIPTEKVVWECLDNTNPAWIGTKLIYGITETENGTSLNFSHANFEEKWSGKDPFEMTKGGWLQYFLPSLVAFCEKGEGQPW